MLCRITGKICTAWSETAGCGLVRCKFVEDKGGDERMTDRRKDCPMRHENGNCTVAGGFCTAVNGPICEALHNAFDCGYRSAIRQQEHFREVTKKVEPLTLDELRQMDGEPVYCVEITGREEWLFRRDGGFADMYGEFTSDDFMVFDNYGKLWWCYRQKPEEGTD